MIDCISFLCPFKFMAGDEPSISLVVVAPESKGMVWKNYWRDIVAWHRVIIEGWLEDVLLGNLSDVATSLPILEKFRCNWKSGKTYFHVLDDGEFEGLDKEHAKKVANGDEEIPAQKMRCDKGVKRPRKGSAAGPRRKKQCTASVVSSDSKAKNQPIASTSTGNAA
jgi:hypothetical protein